MKKVKIWYLCIVMEKIIGFDAKRIVHNATGLGNYGRTLVADIHREAPGHRLLLFTPDSGNANLRCQMEEDATLSYVYPQHRHYMRLRLQRDLWRSRFIVGDMRKRGVQLFHGLSGELPHGLQRAGIRSVVTIHDLIFIRHPEYYHGIDVQIYRQKFRHALKEADVIIAISECTKRDIVEIGGVSPDRVNVVYQSCAQLFQQKAAAEEAPTVAGIPTPFVLTVGSIEERKNLLLLVKALELLPEEIHLVAVGRSTPYAESVGNYARQHGTGKRLHMLHGIGDSELAALYRSASVFAYPSRYEGFGIPVIEAIASGLPVMAATGSCLEEAGGPDSLYVDPDDVDAAADALSRLLAEGRNSDRCHSSRQYITRFGGAGIARQMLDIYDQLF